MDVDTSLPRETGQRLRAERKRQGLSRRRVALDAGFTRRQLVSIERGRRDLTVADVRSFAGSMGVEIGDLLPDGGIFDDTPPPDDLRIEDFLPPAEELPEFEKMAEPDLQIGAALPFVERRKAPLAAARIATLRLAVTELEADPEYAECVARHEQARDEFVRVTTESPQPSWRLRADRTQHAIS